MSDIRERDLITYDPLSEVTRRERRALLGTSLVGLALIKVPLIPSKIGAFGIEFSEINQQNFSHVYALVVLYFLVAFLVYAFSDYVAWRRSEVIRYSAYLQAQQKDPPRAPESRATLVGELGELLRKPVPGPSPAYRGAASWYAALVASRLRAFFEFVVPVLFALYVLRSLILYAP